MFFAQSINPFQKFGQNWEVGQAENTSTLHQYLYNSLKFSLINCGRVLNIGISGIET